MKNIEGHRGLVQSETNTSSEWGEVAALESKYNEKDEVGGVSAESVRSKLHINTGGSKSEVYRRYGHRAQYEVAGHDSGQYRANLGNGEQRSSSGTIEMNRGNIAAESLTSREPLNAARLDRSVSEQTRRTSTVFERSARAQAGPHEFFAERRQERQEQQDKSKQTAIKVAETELKLVNFQTNTLRTKIDEYKSSHGFLSRRFGKASGEFKQFKQQLQFLDRRRAELEAELAAAREQ